MVKFYLIFKKNDIFEKLFVLAVEKCPRLLNCWTGLDRVNFLDVTMDLQKDQFKPYRKPGDKPMYVSSLSNHPPGVLKNIPLGINKRLCEISSSKEVFLEAIPPYQKELDDCGYNYKLVWMEEGMGQSRRKAKAKSKPKV